MKFVINKRIEWSLFKQVSSYTIQQKVVRQLFAKSMGKSNSDKISFSSYLYDHFEMLKPNLILHYDMPNSRP